MCFCSGGVNVAAWLPPHLRLHHTLGGVPAVSFNRRPVGTDGQRRRAQALELARAEDDPAPDDSQYLFEVFDLLCRDREVVGGKDAEIG